MDFNGIQQSSVPFEPPASRVPPAPGTPGAIPPTTPLPPELDPRRRRRPSTRRAAIKHESSIALRVSVVLFWIIGIGAGFLTSLVLVARVTCASGAKGLACGTTGSALGIALVIAVIVVVGVATISALDAHADTRGWIARLVIGVVLLALIAFAGHLLLATA